MIALFSSLLCNCVERYFIEEHETIQPRLVIEGTISDGCEQPVVIVSRSSSTDKAEFIPVSNCEVEVTDANGNVFEFKEDLDNRGHYSSSIDSKFLYIGNRFKLQVITPDNEVCTSSNEEMLPCPPIDSVYYELSQQATSDPAVNIDGLQFYIDFDASDYFGPYYRWVLDETYEYHSSFPKKNYLDINGRLVNSPIDYSTYVCYKTSTVDEISILSTKKLIQNTYRQRKLLFVDNLTQRLLYNYSLLVKQRSLSESAYFYWEKFKKNEKETTGFFTKQPIMVVGNIRNLNDSSNVVLGYFSVSSETTKRIVIPHFREASFFNIEYCKPFPKDVTWPFEPRPLYIISMEWGGISSWPAWAPTECFDCTLLGGVLEKPVFFNE
ncbi:MAG: DUF4249 domain-containing protein [Prolixibacteraceae bacterium]